MLWWIVVVVGIHLLIVAASLWRNWLRPWRDVDRLVQDVIHGRAPRTFIVSGNAAAQRIGIALEDVFVRQRELVSRAQEGESNTRTILGAMRDGLAVIDSEGRVRLLNEVSREMFSIADERLGARALETFGDGAVAEIITRTLRTGETETESLNLRNGTQSSTRRVAVTSLPMHEENGGSHGAVVLFQDVTQLQQLEEIRREFVSNVSHELRTPLSIFRGYLETLIDEPELPPQERERILRVLEKHSTRLQSLVDDLLTLARLEAPDPQLNVEPIAVPEFLRRVASDWEKKAAAKALTIVREIADDLPPIAADEARMEEIMYNLLDNATKYSRSGSRVTISAMCNGEREVTIGVTDEGAGIAAADLPRIFERFYRADKARSREVGGTGLGLAIVKHIAQLHGGFVHAESQLGRGTTIRVTLPVSPATAAPSSSRDCNNHVTAA